MARKGKAKAAAKERASSIRKRDAAKKRGDTKAAMKHGAAARKQGDIMRKASGREKGQRTTYTGPAKQATLTAIEKETGDVLSKTGTKWQQVNKAWLNDIMKKDPKLSLSQARSKLKTIFSNNRERFLTEQQRRYDANIVAPVLDTDIDLDLGNKDKGRGKVVPKITGGSEYLATDYDRPAFQDWSDLEPPNMPGLLGSAKAQQDLLGSGMAAYQPWAQPAIEYQPPVGPTYATRASLLGGASPSAAEAAAAAAAAAAASSSSSSSSSSGDGYTGPLGKSWDNYQDWYINSALNPAVGTNQKAALQRLYQGAGGNDVWDDISLNRASNLYNRTANYSDPYNTWFYGPRGDTSPVPGKFAIPASYTGEDGGILSYSDIVGKR